MKSIREKWDEVVQRRFDGDYEKARTAFPMDEESLQERINSIVPDQGEEWKLAGHKWFCSRVGKSDPPGSSCVCHTL